METKSFDVWNERGLGVDTIMAKAYNAVSASDNQSICDYLYPFVQLINANAVFFDNQEINFIKSLGDWLIHDYGQALSVAPPHNDKQSGIIGSSWQARIMQEVTKIIIQKEWTAVEIIAGTEIMKRHLWIESKRAKFTLTGYTPSESDEKTCKRLEELLKKNKQAWEYELPKKGLEIKVGRVES